MSTWVTPPGSIGDYTCRLPMTYTFEATPSLGGVIAFEWIGQQPPLNGLTLTTSNPSPGVYIAVLVGTPGWVEIPTTLEFTISATEFTGFGPTQNPRTFSMNVTNVVWTTPPGSLGVYTEELPLSVQFSATPSKPSNVLRYTLLNGNYPPGVTGNFILDSVTGLLFGTPAQVSENVTSSFTLRVMEYTSATSTTPIAFADRSFSITISGTTAPQFITPGPALFTVQDSTWTEFQIRWTNPDPGATTLITLSDGQLPPGLEVNQTGLIRGYAQPPATASQTYTFTLRIRGPGGESYATYNITILNQQFQPGFVARRPVILNNKPLTFNIPQTDPYRDYYFTGENIGVFKQDNEILFKFIGYDFDNVGISYELAGASDLISPTPTPGKLYFNTSTGWLSGSPPINTLEQYQIFNFSVRAFQTSNPSISSDIYLYSITIVGSQIVDVTWTTQPYLGTIDNGSISTFNVSATAPTGITLTYRVVGDAFNYNLNTINSWNSNWIAAGQDGGLAVSNDGVSWIPETDNLISSGRFNINGSVVRNELTPTLIAVGGDVDGFPIIAETSDGLTWVRQPWAGTRILRSIARNNGTLMVTVGDRGTIAYSNNGSTWGEIGSPISENLNQITWAAGRWVIVANNGMIMSSTDSLNWTPVFTGVFRNLYGITWTGSRWIAVGDLGCVLVSTDTINWTPYTIGNRNFRSVTTFNNGTTNVPVIVGQDGTIYVGTNIGTLWSLKDSGTINDLQNVTVINAELWAVGSGGTIITSINGEDWTSPTLGQLPPQLVLQPTGLITGRVSFQIDSPATQDTVTSYSFSVQAYSQDIPEVNTTRRFTVDVLQYFKYPYDNVYIKLLASQGDRLKLEELYDIVPTDPNIIYRPTDTYFGSSRSVIYQHIFGVPSVASDVLLPSWQATLERNHFWRNITLGPLKTAIARNSDGQTIYEVVYSEIIDNLVNDKGETTPQSLIWPQKIQVFDGPWYTASEVLRSNDTYWDPTPIISSVATPTTNNTTVFLTTVLGVEVGQTAVGVAGVQLQPNFRGEPPRVVEVRPRTDPLLPNTVVLDTPQTLTWNDQISFNTTSTVSRTNNLMENNLLETVRTLYPNSLPNMRKRVSDVLGQINDPRALPLWMSSQQTNGSSLGYTPAWVICYTQPGKSEQVKTLIQNNWPYELNDIDFKLDRLEIQRSKTYNYEGAPATVPIWGTLPSADPSVNDDSKDEYVYFPRTTILPTAPGD